MRETQKHTKPNVPNLRFPGFEGEWEKHTLGELGEPYIGLTYSPADVVQQGGIIVFRSSNIQNGEIDYSDIVRVEKKIKDSIRTRKDDLLICARNGSPRLIGKNALLGENEASQTFGAFMLVFRSDDNHFIHQLLSTKSYYSQVNENLGARINQITTANIKDYEFSIPRTKVERDKIASFLDLIDKRISIQNKVIRKYESLIRAIYYEILSNASGKRIQLGDIVQIKKGTQLNGENLLSSGKYYVMNGGISPSGFYDHYNTPGGIISISEGGNSCGYVQYNSLPFWSGGHCYTLLRQSQYADSVKYRYLYHFLKYHQDDIMAMRIGSGLPNIQKKDLEKFQVILPNTHEQKRYMTLFDAVDSIIALEKDLLNSLLEEKAYLISRMFI